MIWFVDRVQVLQGIGQTWDNFFLRSLGRHFLIVPQRQNKWKHFRLLQTEAKASNCIWKQNSQYFSQMKTGMKNCRVKTKIPTAWKKWRSPTAEATVGVEMTEVAAVVCGQGKCVLQSNPGQVNRVDYCGHNTCISFLPHVPSPELPENLQLLLWCGPSVIITWLGTRAVILVY